MTSDETAIIRLHQEFADAWSECDTVALAEAVTEDAVRVGAFGDVQHGRAEIKTAYDKLLGGKFQGATVKIEPGTVRMLTPEFAVWEGSMQITPSQGRPPIKGFVIDVMQKVGGKWLMLETHPKLFPAGD